MGYCYYLSRGISARGFLHADIGCAARLVDDATGDLVAELGADGVLIRREADSRNLWRPNDPLGHVRNEPMRIAAVALADEIGNNSAARSHKGNEGVLVADGSRR